MRVCVHLMILDVRSTTSSLSRDTTTNKMRLPPACNLKLETLFMPPFFIFFFPPISSFFCPKTLPLKYMYTYIANSDNPHPQPLTPAFTAHHGWASSSPPSCSPCHPASPLSPCRKCPLHPYP